MPIAGPSQAKVKKLLQLLIPRRKAQVPKRQLTTIRVPIKVNPPLKKNLAQARKQKKNLLHDQLGHRVLLINGALKNTFFKAPYFVTD